MPGLPTTPVTFFGGKGGVGKTTMAAAFALRSAEEGSRTLLVSTDPAHSTGDILGVPLTDEAREVLPNLHALEIDPEAEAERYIADVKARVREVASPRILDEVEREIDLARSSPGSEEAALLDRFAELMRAAGGEYDRVVFDTAPTGHTVRLLSLPELMGRWIDGLVSRRRKVRSLGRMWRNVAGAAAGDAGRADDPVLAALERRQERFRAARDIVTDARRTAFVFVITPERLPILETQKAVAALARSKVPVAGLIVNRVLPADAGGEFLARRRMREADYLSEIDDAFANLPRLRVSLFDSDIQGMEALRRVIAVLEDVDGTGTAGILR
ncbi:MAG TPA: ArsA family ATPase [Longimicrobiales bacterium]|nr:ArsA family ATPase [Longimicrobiales bacterium]